MHFSHHYKLAKVRNFFRIYKAIKKQLFFIFQPILKNSDLTNSRYIEQKLLGSFIVRQNEGPLYLERSYMQFELVKF